jgi:hypothetical protein
MAEFDFSTPAYPGMRVLVDDEDAAWISSRKWTPQPNGSGQNYFASVKGRQKIVLHREVARARFYEHVDHINGDTLDNRKANLRTCTAQQNTWNQTSHKRGNAYYRGVHNVNGRYKAMITAHGVTYNLGTYDAAEEAALARDAAALHLHGEFAFLNFPDAGTVPKAPRSPIKYAPRG